MNIGQIVFTLCYAAAVLVLITFVTAIVIEGRNILREFRKPPLEGRRPFDWRIDQ